MAYTVRSRTVPREYGRNKRIIDKSGLFTVRASSSSSGGNVSATWLEDYIELNVNDELSIIQGTGTFPIATRVVTPTDNGIAVWDDTNKVFETSLDITLQYLTVSTGASITGLTVNNPAIFYDTLNIAGLASFDAGIDVTGNGDFTGDISAVNAVLTTLLSIGDLDISNGSINQTVGNLILTSNDTLTIYGSSETTINAGFSNHVSYFDDDIAEHYSTENFWQGFLRSQTYGGDEFDGSGWKLTPDDGSGHSLLTIDNLVVRRILRVYELEIDKISHIGGTLILSVGHGKVTSYTGTNPYNLYIDTEGGSNPIQFAVNDTVYAQVYTRSGTASFSGTVTAVDQTNGFVTVTSGNNPWVGMDLVQLGNSTDTTRQGIMYLTSRNNPYLSILTGVVDDDFADTLRIRLGYIGDIVTGGGYGLYGTTDGTNEAFVISSEGFARIAGWSFDNAKLYNGTDIVLNASTKAISVANGAVSMYYTSATDYGIKDSDGKFNLGYVNQIAGWNFDTGAFWYGISKTEPYIILDATNKFIAVTRTTDYGEGYAKMFQTSSTSYGIEVTDSLGSYVFRTGYVNEIAGWNFDDSRIYKDLTEINSDGFIYFDANTSNDSFSGIYFRKDNDIVGGLNPAVGALNGTTWDFTQGFVLKATPSSYTTGNEPTTEFGETSIVITDAGTSSSAHRVAYMNASLASRGRRVRPSLVSTSPIPSSDVAQYDIFRTTSNLSLPSSDSGRDSSGNFYDGKTIIVINQSASTIVISGLVNSTTFSIGTNRMCQFVFYNGSWFSQQN